MGRRILYVQYTDPAGYPPLEHSSGLLADRGWDVVLLGIVVLPGHGLKLPFHPRVRVHTMNFFKEGWKQKLQYVLFFLWTLYWTWWWRPEWIYASDPLCTPALWFVRKLTNVKIVYHEHDSPVGTPNTSRFMRIVLAYRQKLGREAELCVLPQQNRLVDFIKTTQRSGPAYCVWNCPRRSEVVNDKASERNESGSGRLIVYYHGSITNTRLPAELIVAASRFKGAVRFRIAGYEPLGSVGHIQELKKLGAENGVSDLINYIGSVPSRKDLLRFALGADVGLSLMPKSSNDINLQHMVGASNKPFDCMACGLPLLVTDLPEWTSTFVELGFARACDPHDANSLEMELRWYLDHPNERFVMGQKCRDKIQRTWNYETTFAEVLAKLEKG